jgi:methylglutaconyl-CoA hydratase
MKYETIEIQVRDAVGAIWLNRPDVRNAFNEVMIEELISAFAELGKNDAIRVVVLAGHGKAFCTGGDVSWMKKMSEHSVEEKQKGAMAMAAMLHHVYIFPKPTVARVHGAAFAGGMGLLAACDVAVASTEAEFCISEVKLGVIPATISPYVLAAIGERTASRYFLTAERFSADEAHRINLVHKSVPPDDLDSALNEICHHLVQGGPGAHVATKELIRSIGRKIITPEVVADTASRIAAVWASDEGKEGIRSFLERRAPTWRTPSSRQ